MPVLGGVDRSRRGRGGCEGVRVFSSAWLCQWVGESVSKLGSGGVCKCVRACECLYIQPRRILTYNTDAILVITIASTDLRIH